jgi:hypothetical protein
MGTQRYFAALGMTAALVLSVVVAVNFTVDVGQAFRLSDHQSYVNEYARRLVSSRYGLYYSPLERPIKLRLAQTSKADCFVTGASHEWTITLDRAPALRRQCQTLLNLGVSASSYPDALTFLAQVARRGNAKVFVGVDPWFFHLHADYRSFQDDDPAYQSARNYFGLPALVPPVLQTGKYVNLVNGEYFLRNVEQIITANGKTLAPIVEARGAENTEDLFRPDGSFVYNNTKQIIEEFPKCYDYKVSPPYVDQAVVDEFERVIGKLRTAGVDVSLILMPYHPGLFRCAGHTVPALHTVEKTSRAIAAKLSLQVLGGYEPTQFGLDARDFLDPDHVMPESIHRVLR